MAGPVMKAMMAQPGWGGQPQVGYQATAPGFQGGYSPGPTAQPQMAPQTQQQPFNMQQRIAQQNQYRQLNQMNNQWIAQQRQRSAMMGGRGGWANKGPYDINANGAISAVPRGASQIIRNPGTVRPQG